MDKELDMESEEISQLLAQCPGLDGHPVERVLMGARRFVERLQEAMRGSKRLRRIGGPKDLRFLIRKELSRPEASMAHRCHCEEPAGEGWGDD